MTVIQLQVKKIWKPENSHKKNQLIILINEAPTGDISFFSSEK
jgi:hypothetical protein